MKVLVAIIAYNEEKNIKNTIRDLRKNNFGYDIVVFDNGSKDDTVKIARQMEVDVIAHCINTGGSGGALRTYFLYAYKNSYDILCQFDGDGQHIASELPKIINPIKNDEADYVIGSRFLNKKGFQSTPLRRIGIKLFSFLDSLIIGEKILDITSGARAYNQKVINFFACKYRHEIYDTSQLILLSHFAGLRIQEVPVEMRKRKYGKSEYNLFNAISFPIKGIINVIGIFLQRNLIKRG